MTVPYAGIGATCTHALLALCEAALRDRREVDPATLDHDTVREVMGGTAVLHRVQADTHPMEPTP